MKSRTIVSKEWMLDKRMYIFYFINNKSELWLGEMIMVDGEYSV